MSSKRASPAPTAPASDARRSAETIAKRRAARAFNELLLGPRRTPDGRTERRRRRLLRELEAHARGDRTLKPVDLLVRVDALLDLETPLEAIERALPPPPPLPPTPELARRLRALQEAYAFREACFPFVGIALAGPTVRKAARRPASKRGAA